MRITYVRHTTLFIETARTSLLVDPFFSQAPYPWYALPEQAELDLLGRAEGVLCTDAHFNHFEIPALLAAIPAQMPIIAHPHDTENLLEGTRLNTVPLATWARYSQGDLTIVAVPARNHHVAQSYIIQQDGGPTLFIAGDTLFHEGLYDIAWYFPQIDLACMPVDGMQYNWQGITMNAEEAQRATEVLHPRQVIPLHMGDVPAAQGTGPRSSAATYAAQMRDADINTTVTLLEPGDTLTLASRASHVPARVPVSTQ